MIRQQYKQIRIIKIWSKYNKYKIMKQIIMIYKYKIMIYNKINRNNNKI